MSATLSTRDLVRLPNLVSLTDKLTTALLFARVATALVFGA